MLDAATIHSADVLRGSPKFDRQNFFEFEAPPLVDLEKNVLRSACKAIVQQVVHVLLKHRPPMRVGPVWA